MIQVTVWGENVHEQLNPAVRANCPEGMHSTIASALRQDPALAVKTATLEQPEHGLTEAALEETDVLTWWGHKAHKNVAETIVDRGAEVQSYLDACERSANSGQWEKVVPCA